MTPSIIDQISASPSLKWVVVAICFQIVNVFVGAYMGFIKRGRTHLRVHKYLYWGILFCLGYYLILNGVHSQNTVWEYLIGLYYITIIPISKRWDVVFHAFAAVVGLLFLPLLILLQFV